MKIVDNWRKVLKKAWSLRLMALAATLSGIEATLPLLSDAIPHGIFSILSFVSVAGAFVARFIAQEELHGEPTE